MDRFHLPDDEPIDVAMISRAVAEAQSKVEGANFDMRKHLLDYDDVLNKHRAAVYKRRQEILTAMNSETLEPMIFDAVNGYFKNLFAGITAAGNMPEAEKPDLKKIFGEVGLANNENPYPEDASEENLTEFLKARVSAIAKHPLAANQMLGILDMLWMNHLEDLDALSESIGLRAYGQRDPLVEYRGEAHTLYQAFWANFGAWIFMNIFKLPPPGEAQEQKPVEQVVKILPKTSGAKEVGRNDPCPCGAKHEDGRPMKYKHCHGKNS